MGQGLDDALRNINKEIRSVNRVNSTIRRTENTIKRTDRTLGRLGGYIGGGEARMPKGEELQRYQRGALERMEQIGAVKLIPVGQYSNEVVARIDPRALQNSNDDQDLRFLVKTGAIKEDREDGSLRLTSRGKHLINEMYDVKCVNEERRHSNEERRHYEEHPAPRREYETREYDRREQPSQGYVADSFERMVAVGGIKPMHTGPKQVTLSIDPSALKTREDVQALGALVDSGLAYQDKGTGRYYFEPSRIGETAELYQRSVERLR